MNATTIATPCNTTYGTAIGSAAHVPPIRVRRKSVCDGETTALVSSSVSPLDVARHERWAALPTAALVRLAAEPWSAQNHELFPAKERGRVPEYLLVGRQLSARAARSGGALWDCWVSHVMAFAVERN